MRDLTRERHRVVVRVLDMLDAEFLSSVSCYFGGGTRIVLELNEYRESMDIDFLCADRVGYRELRSTVTNVSLGKVFNRKVELLREIRSDMYGIRCFLNVDDQPLKFEIVSEGRIPLGSESVRDLPVAVLDRPSAFAEKLLANADRGRDRSTYSRDVVDLAFMAASWPEVDLEPAFAIADAAYGDAIERELAASFDMIGDTTWRRQCIDALALSEPRRLTSGIKALRRMVDR